MKEIEVVDLPSYLTVNKLGGETVVECCLCGEKMKLRDMRNHVGRHILLALRDIDENVALKPGMKVGVDPCGFCRLDGCKVQLTKKGKSQSTICSCKYHYTKMIYSMAAKCTKNPPCTNVPIHWPLCPSAPSGQPRTIWKYNVMYHLAELHANLGSDETMPKIPGELLVEAFITSEEEDLMGILRNGGRKMT